MNTRADLEKDFHNNRYKEDPRKKLSLFYYICGSIWGFYITSVEQSVKDKVVLELGCGFNSIAKRIAAQASEVHAIDISDIAINRLKEETMPPNLYYRLMNAENLEFESEKFDFIYGSGILHHLHLDKALSSITRVLKKNGRAVFWEPLGHNFFINSFRQLTPSMRTSDEHPLLEKDLKNLNHYFEKVEIRYYYLTAFLALIFGKTSLTRATAKLFEYIDNFIFLIFPFTKKYAWQVCITLSSPKTSGG